MRARQVCCGIGATALALAVLAGVAAAADGDRPAAVGWWTRAPGASAAPEGGFEVAAVGSEPASVAALRFAVSGSPTTATLTLVESGGTVTPATALQVCTTSDAWERANPGAYDEAPEPDCTAAVELTRDEEAKEWSAEVGSLLAGGSLMVVPSETPGGGSPISPGFRVTFSEAALAAVTAPPAAASPAFAEPSGGGSGGGDGGMTFAPPPASSPSSDFGSGSSGFAVTPAPAAPPDAGTTVTTVAVDGGEDGAALGGDEEAFGAPELAAGAAPSRGAGKPWGRLLVLVPLSAAVGVATVRGQKLLAQRATAEP